jgi:hypothetical protein
MGFAGNLRSEAVGRLVKIHCFKCNKDLEISRKQTKSPAVGGGPGNMLPLQR